MQTLNNSIISKKNFFLALLSLALFAVAYFPALQIFVEKWSTSEEYSHAFITIPIILYMVWVKREPLSKIKSQYTSIGLILVICSSLIYLFALLTNVHTIIALSTYITIMGCLVYLLGVNAIKELFTPLFLLLILIPVPDQLYIKLTFPLQLKVSQVSEFFVRILGVPIFREGNIMTIPEKSFEVVEACSGLRSMITLLTLSIIMGFYMLKNNFSKLLLLIASIPTAIAVNIIRVSSMILLFHFFRLDLTDGAWHTITGLLVFGLALLTLLLIQRGIELWEEKQK